MYGYIPRAPHGPGLLESILQTIRNGIPQSIGQMQRFIVACLPVDDEMPNSERNLDKELRKRDAPRARLYSGQYATSTIARRNSPEYCKAC